MAGTCGYGEGLSGSINAGNFLQSLLVSFSRRTLLHGVSKYRTLHVSDRFSVHHQESSTAYTATGICHTGFADCLLAGSGWSSILILHDIYLLLCIQCIQY